MVEDFWQEGGVKNEVKDQRNKKKYWILKTKQKLRGYIAVDMRVYYLWDNASKMLQKVTTAQIHF